MPGPAPQPTNLKILRGNPGKRPLKKDEPRIPAAIPKPPNYLNPEAKKHFNKTARMLAKYGLMTEIDSDALAMYCAAWYQWKSALLHIRRDRPIKKVKGKISRSAWLSIAEKSFNQMRQLALEFGMTPSSRGKLEINLPKKPDSNPWGEL